MTPEPVVRALSEVNLQSLEEAGGKAASLGAMLAAGIPVPPGFVITTAAFRAGLTAGLKQQVMAAYRALGAGRVAVRSSAVAEDSGGASWAGQLETVLNVTSGGLLAAVEQCRQSIKSPHAQEYAARHQVPEPQQAVAVVVQAMVDSEISGVMFTVNPVTQNRSELMVEAAHGLGELLVQGQITPENLVVEKSTGRVIQRHPGSQQVQLVYRGGHTREIPVDPAVALRPVLTQSQIEQLAALARSIEQLYQAPQDIEWALAGGKFYVVQSRPITTLK